jgi:hypothetical protein
MMYIINVGGFMLKLFEQCPACGGPYIITECRCTNCHLEMRGEFAPGQFSSLTEDQLTFVRAFLRVRGNLSEMEKVLGVSYPTIRNKLDEINKALEGIEVTGASSQDNIEGAAVASRVPDEARRAILKQVAAGQLSAAEAIQQLKMIQGG